MKKILIILISVLLLAGCSNANQDASDGSSGDNSYWSQTENGITKKITIKENEQNGATSKVIAYSELYSDGTGMGFGITRVTTGNTVLYKALIALKGTSPFTDTDFNKYLIDVGGSSIFMQSPAGGALVEEGIYEFAILGSLYESQITFLKNINSDFTVKIWKDSNQNLHSINVNYKFIEALIRNF